MNASQKNEVKIKQETRYLEKFCNNFYNNSDKKNMEKNTNDFSKKR
jgi:hypothetical protein